MQSRPARGRGHRGRRPAADPGRIAEKLSDAQEHTSPPALPQGAAFCGTPSLPCTTAGAGCGTLMSYCHLLSGGLRNTTLTFGEGHPHGVLPGRVPQRMRTHVANQALTNAACLALSDGGEACEDLVVSGVTISTVQSFAACDTLFAGPGVRVTGAGRATFTARRVVLRNGFSVASGGRLTVRTQ